MVVVVDTAVGVVVVVLLVVVEVAGARVVVVAMGTVVVVLGTVVVVGGPVVVGAGCVVVVPPLLYCQHAHVIGPLKLTPACMVAIGKANACGQIVPSASFLYSTFKMGLPAWTSG